MPRQSIKEEIRDAYHDNRVLWAVIKGFDTPEAIAARLKWTMERTLREITKAHGGEYIRLHGDRYLPVNPRYRTLKYWVKRKEDERAKRVKG